ncbi:uncharacterized protein LOC117101216 isoform X2 [Anneissia japonica]|nr:uncharacterized protein LOC117101216 isoform X2 [Anneissia japonica]XP_033097037.1 uncharacterized protein LOC117101216 isoform X2 [Anneissia japonica]XP_033097047.1 uncharacterized protein LOC117101216 isoform X2 [Anneissia japonica]
MKFKWKMLAVGTLFTVGVYLSVHQSYQIDPGYWRLMDEDNVIQPRAQKSGEEKNYAAKHRGTVSSLTANKTKLHKPPIVSTAVFLNSSRKVLPWIDRNIFLPNYFTTNLTEVEKSVYKNSVIIYLHHNKAAGTTTKKCMLKVIPKSGKKLGPVLSSSTRLTVSRRMSTASYRDSYSVFMGGYAFGLCDEILKPCSYFTVFRDPYHRSISSFSYCRRARSDQLCRAQSPWKVTLKEWAIHQGSFLFRQLLFHPKFCSEFKNNFKASLLPHDIYGSTPCWFRQKVIMLDILSKDQINALVDFCVNNLEKWFAVVGLTEEYDTSLAMIEQVYGVPFKSCEGSVQNTSGRYNNLSNVKNETVLDEHSQMVQDLMNDKEVQRALYADLRLYNKIKEIFNKQKEKMGIKNK